MPELTETDMADYIVTFHLHAASAPRKIRAVYVTEDDKTPGMLAFKDHRHRTVALVNKDSVLAVDRAEEAGKVHPGFQPTSQVLEHGGRMPEDIR